MGDAAIKHHDVIWTLHVIWMVEDDDVGNSGWTCVEEEVILTPLLFHWYSKSEASYMIVFFFFLLCISYFHFWLLMLKSVSSLLSSFPTLFFSYQTSYTGTLANTFIPCAWNVIPSGYLLVGSSLSAQMFPPQKFDYYVGSPSPVALHCIPVVFSFFPALITI